MTSTGKGVGTAPEHDFPAIGLQGMAQGLAPGSLPINAGSQSLHVAVIDSHSLTRECITQTIAYLFENAKVFSFLSVPDLSRKAYDFNLIVLYLHASEYQPLELIRTLREAHSDATLFLISDLDYQTSPDFIRAAWRLGARGFVSTKTTGLTLALSAIRFVQAGGFFAPVDAMLYRTPTSSVRQPQPGLPATTSELTARERVVLGLLKEGKTNKAIARELRLSDNTVKVHVHNILRKMHVSSRREAASILSPATAGGDGAVLMI
jgi:DNA-binding NarL/FixJ family response regulator